MHMYENCKPEKAIVTKAVTSAQIHMDQSENDEYIGPRHPNRPSVIYFHGLTEKSTGNILAENKVKKCSKPKEEDFTSKRKRILNADSEVCTQDPVCLEEHCLRKRHRTSFTSFQLARLEEEFAQDCYIVGMKRWRLSVELDIPEKQIKIWFQNKRTKMKKHSPNRIDEETRAREQFE